MRPRWRRRVAVVVTYSAFGVTIAAATSQPWWGHQLLAMWVFCVLVLGFGVFRGMGPLKSFEEPPARVFVNGLDAWARYRYAAPSFEVATAEQQKELLRTYRVGTYAVPAKRHLDERRCEREILQCAGH